MGKIVIGENISLDGVIQDPTGEEGFRFGGWFNQIGDQDRAAWAQVELDEALGSEALLLGRRNYDYFASRWTSRTGEWADRPRRLPTSGRLAHTLMEHDLVDELRLMIYPFVLGGGQRIFGETSDTKPLRLVDTRIVGESLALLTYQVVPTP